MTFHIACFCGEKIETEEPSSVCDNCGAVVDLEGGWRETLSAINALPEVSDGD